MRYVYNISNIKLMYFGYTKDIHHIILSCCNFLEVIQVYATYAHCQGQLVLPDDISILRYL